MEFLLLFTAIIVASVLFYVLNRTTSTPRTDTIDVLQPEVQFQNVPARPPQYDNHSSQANFANQSKQQITITEGTTMSYNPNQISDTPPQQAKTNTLAIVSLVSAFLISIVAVITGHMALKQIELTGEQGRGLAIAGLILGYIGLAAGLIYFIVAMSSLAALTSY